ARAADPACKLFINDYNTELPAKRGRFLEIISGMIARGVPLDGVGHQFHLQVNANPADSLAAIDAVDALGAGLENHATEIDVSIYADPGTCFDTGVNCAAGYGAQISNVPASVLAAQARIYRGLFDGFVQRPSVTSVTVWGLQDGQSWLNSFPVTRPNYPLLFDPARQPKPAFRAITDPAYVI
ncbi:endo-1,4-beta-xylanase, partial [Hyphomonas sp.]|uniref:endo-1,4-beta-xylanase n=1 Tax=Hyphomonas sp. TaxID=87 RepID=UPI00391D8246